MLYQAYRGQRGVFAPARAMATAALDLLDLFPTPLREHPAVRFTSAGYELMERSHLVHTRPPWGIDEVNVGTERVAVHEEAVEATPFCTLRHFRKDLAVEQPKVLLVAALAGHFATLLRPTVQALLPDHDVYVSDWHNARDVPVADGAFGFDDYVEHVIRFVRRVGEGTHVLSVCQPCPGVLAATALMAQGGESATPRSLTLMAGPVDTRVNPTAINDFAQRRPLSWYARNAISTVPGAYAGAGRRVYPGFLQFGAFFSLNWARHVDRHLDLFHALAFGDHEQAGAIKDFYDEYCAVLDMPAEFYLETVDRVFQRHHLPRGVLHVRGQRVDPGAITRTALLTVEGERDDMCSVGQTAAAHGLCGRVPAAKRGRLVQPGVGHYGVFAGSTWERSIYPVFRDFVAAND